MSYDLMVFDPVAAPMDRAGFMTWFQQQTQWGEEHGYNDPKVTTPALQSWFAEIIQTFPPMNGPFASQDYDNPKLSDYSIGRSIIYATFGWPQMEAAYAATLKAAMKHGVGFFDVSANEGQVRLPTSGGNYEVVHGIGCSTTQLGDVRVIHIASFIAPLPRDDS